MSNQEPPRVRFQSGSSRLRRGRVSILARFVVCGTAINLYTASCVDGANTFTATRITSPITVTGLLNGTNYTCTVNATNAVGTGGPSAPVNVTPDANAPLTVVSAVSRKIHGGAGTFDLDIALAPNPASAVTVDPRSIGSGHMIVFQFNAPISSPGTVSVAPIGAATATFLGNEVMVTLTNLPDNQRVTITLANVNSSVNPPATSVGFLVGDVNNTRSVNSSDISGVKARSGQTTTAANFKFDLNATGAINSSDISAVKARSGLTLP